MLLPISSFTDHQQSTENLSEIVHFIETNLLVTSCTKIYSVCSCHCSLLSLSLFWTGSFSFDFVAVRKKSAFHSPCARNYCDRPRGQTTVHGLFSVNGIVAVLVQDQRLILALVQRKFQRNTFLKPCSILSGRKQESKWRFAYSSLCRCSWSQK